jgi:hypothetical protein
MLMTYYETRRKELYYILPLQGASIASEVASRTPRRLQMNQIITVDPENANVMITYTQKFDATVKAFSRSEYAKKLDPNNV